ncbi:hypothetical protein [Rugosimonospora africana]|uniref:Uncharacterized protein n=1 Tax=Rugosimonospora africana TaxID=556532 RepID=A0A8J3VSA5_9ACTN|nr:hypothetical protein [Rugosimonospora africana]GIH16376.1 hypothetical protein Raf01_45480 [Rugosimonospora africana]
MRRADLLKVLIRGVVFGVFMAVWSHFLSSKTWTFALTWWIPACVLFTLGSEMHGWTRFKVWVMRRTRPPETSPSPQAVQQPNAAADDVERDPSKP